MSLKPFTSFEFINAYIAFINRFDNCARRGSHGEWIPCGDRANSYCKDCGYKCIFTQQANQLLEEAKNQDIRLSAPYTKMSDEIKEVIKINYDP